MQAQYLGEISLKNVDYKVRTYALQGVGLPVPEFYHEKEISGHFWAEVKRRGVLRAGLTYVLLGVLITLLFSKIQQWAAILPDWDTLNIILILAIGLPIALFLAWNFERSPEGLVRTTSAKSWKNPLKPGKRKPLTGRYVIIGLSIAILVLYFYPGKSLPGNTTGHTETSSFPAKSIAVLPFKNLSGSDENLYFSDGVMEAILNNLSRIQDLKVISRTSVEQYRNQNKSIPEIARELEVANILEGSVQRVGDEVRVTAQLISAENDEHIWADNYDRHLTDIFSIQSEIAQTIADNLEVIMTMEERELIKNAPTSNLKAYELYLKADNIRARTEDKILEAISLLDEAIKLDPDFGWPYALKGDFLSSLSVYGYSKSIWQDSVHVLADIAIEKDSKDYFAYGLKGWLHDMVHDDATAIRYFEKSISINPNFSYSYFYLGTVYSQRGEFEKAIDYLLKGLSLNRATGEDYYQRNGFLFAGIDFELACQNFYQAFERNPENTLILAELVTCHRYFKEHDKALEYALKYLKLNPDLVNAKSLVAETYLALQNFEKAETYYREMMSRTDQFQDNYMVYPFVHRLGYAMMKNGKTTEGISLMQAYADSLQASILRKEVTAAAMGEYYDLAIINAALNKKEEAYKWLRTAQEKESIGAFFRTDYLIFDPMLDNLREDPELKEILAEKFRQNEQVKSIFRRRLAEYHGNHELKWLNAN